MVIWATWFPSQPEIIQLWTAIEASTLPSIPDPFQTDSGGQSWASWYPLFTLKLSASSARTGKASEQMTCYIWYKNESRISGLDRQAAAHRERWSGHQVWPYTRTLFLHRDSYKWNSLDPGGSVPLKPLNCCMC